MTMNLKSGPQFRLTPLLTWNRKNVNQSKTLISGFGMHQRWHCKSGQEFAFNLRTIKMSVNCTSQSMRIRFVLMKVQSMENECERAGENAELNKLVRFSFCIIKFYWMQSIASDKLPFDCSLQLIDLLQLISTFFINERLERQLLFGGSNSRYQVVKKLLRRIITSF